LRVLLFCFPFFPVFPFLQAVKKSVKGKAYIDDDEHDKNKLLLGLGCVLVAIGAPIIGVFGKKVDDGESHIWDCN
jgi:hypothetical protein